MNILILGYGKMGKIRHKILQKINEVNKIYIFDNKQEIFNKNLKKSFFIKNLKIIDNKIDAVFVCTYVSYAPIYVKKYLSLKIPVFCEKPPAKSLSSLKSIIKIEKKFKTLLMYGFNHRHHNNIIFLKKLLKNKFGKILWIRAEYGKAGSLDFHKNWRNFKKFSGGGILLDQGIHMLDLFNYITNSVFKLKYSISSKSFWKIEVEDNTFLTLINEDSIIATLHSSANYWKHKFNMEICTENGFIELNGLVTPSKTYAPELIKYALKNKKTGQINKFQKKTFYKDNSFEIETLNFIKLIKLPKNSSYNFSMDSLSLMKTIDQVYKKDISIRN